MVDAYGVAQYAIKHAQAKCCVCAKAPESGEMERDESGDVLTLIYRCHGAVDVVKIPGIRRMAQTQNFGALIDAIPRRVFLRNWAEYRTTTKPERRRI